MQSALARPFDQASKCRFLFGENSISTGVEIRQRVPRRRTTQMNQRSWNGPGSCLLIGRTHPVENIMKLTVIALSAAALIASAPAVFAQGSSAKAPGQEMQERGSVKGSPGASGYAPGQEMQAKGSKKGTQGASGYAPGQTSGSSNSGMSGPSSTTTKSK
jgi:hypothetical protein